MIDELPDAPDPAVDPPSVFSTKAAALVLAQKSMVPQFNAAIAAFNAAMAGGAYSIPYVFDATTTDADPTAGKLRLDNLTQNAATTIRLDVVSNGIGDVTSILDRFDASSSLVKGSLRIVKQGDITKWLTFDVTARAAPSGYRNITVVNTGGSSANPFTATDAVLLYFTRNGDAGNLMGYPMLHVRDEKASGAQGGAGVVGIQARTLNTVKKNSITGASLASNQITLPAGTYRFRGSAPASSGNAHQALLYNVTDASYAGVGSSEYTNVSNNISRSFVNGEIIIAATKVYEFRHFISATAVNSLGMSSSSGQVEVYAEIIFEKVA